MSPKKPTEPYGHIVFGKDGSVRPEFESLPATKVGQEGEVARRFAGALSTLGQVNWQSRPLPENDHDFELFSDAGQIQVQAVEIAARYDYLVPIAEDAWKNSTHGFQSVEMLEPNRFWGVDRQKKFEVVWAKIQQRRAKNYSKPKSPLWLLIWTVHTGLPFEWVQEGVRRTSESISLARRQLRQMSCEPFDEIWMWSARGELVRLWPYEGAIPDPPETPDRKGQIGMYIPAHLVTASAKSRRRPTMTPNLTLIRNLYAAYASRDMATIFATLSPDIRITQAAALPWGGVFEGTARAQRFMGLLTSHIDSVATIERIFEAGDQVVVTGRTSGTVKANGAPFDVHIAHVLTVRDGKVVAADYYIDTPAMLAALGASR